MHSQICGVTAQSLELSCDLSYHRACNLAGKAIVIYHPKRVLTMAFCSFIVIVIATLIIAVICNQLPTGQKSPITFRKENLSSQSAYILCSREFQGNLGFHY